MNLFKIILNYFQQLLTPTSPEVKKRVALKKLEQDLKSKSPQLYKNDMLLPNFAEAVRVLYISTKPIFDLLAETICSEDLERNKHFTEQLILTGFSDEAQTIIEDLSYENRKKAAQENLDNLQSHFEMEYSNLESVLSELNSPVFEKIDLVICSLKQLNDVCRQNYVSMLKLFDSRFSVFDDYKPTFQPIPLNLAENALQDIFYVLCGLDISSSTENAIKALYQLYHTENQDKEEIKQLSDSLKKIQSVAKNVLTEDTLEKLIQLSKGDPEKKADRPTYKANDSKVYASYLKNRFTIDESRLKNELQNESAIKEINQLFEDKVLSNLVGYNEKNNEILKQNSPCSFYWVLQMQILKTFITVYYDEKVKPMLNDIVIEGFFTTNDYKSNFSAAVYALNESSENVKAFEKKFDHQGAFDENLILGFIRDSHKDADFTNKLKLLVAEIDKEAKNILQQETINVINLYKMLVELVTEAKKPASDIISNIKILAMSSRNRDNFNFLDANIDKWNTFITVMKSYVPINLAPQKN